MPGPAVGRKVTDAHEARKLLEAWQASGQPMAQWCKDRGINWYSLCAYSGWTKRKPLDGFVEIDTTELIPHHPAHTALYRVVLNDRVVEVDEHFDEHVLHRLLRVVAAC